MKIIFTLFFTITLLASILISCKDDENNNGNTDNNIKNNTTVINALAAAGITTYDGNTPPSINGDYSTSPMQVYNATGALTGNIGYNMTTIFKLSEQTSSGSIKFAEQISPNLFANGKGCFITGSGQNFTIWMENTLSNGAATAFVLSGTLSPTTGDFLNCKSLTVYTKASVSINVGDWYAASGWIDKLPQSSVTCSCSDYDLSRVTFSPYSGTSSRKYGVYITGGASDACNIGTVTYTFSNNIPSKTVNLNVLCPTCASCKGYYEISVPTTNQFGAINPFTVYANLSISNGTNCTYQLYINN